MPRFSIFEGCVYSIEAPDLATAKAQFLAGEHEDGTVIERDIRQEEPDVGAEEEF